MGSRPKTWWKQVHLRYAAANLGLPLYVAYHAPSTSLQWKTCVWTLIYAFMTGLSITAGYHRLWTHQAYKACLPLRIVLAALGAGALQLPIRVWAADHRAHHRFTDTDRDPYNAKRGLFYTHIGWILTYNPDRFGHKTEGVDLSDLDRDPVVVWQRRTYYPLAGLMGFLLPAAVAGMLWGDWQGGFLYAGCLRVVLVWHVSYCINSLAHWIGEQSYSTRNSARDCALLAVVTLGEGYHNYHHAFPGDYRNGVRRTDLDVTKWWIWAWERVGLAWDVRRCTGWKARGGGLGKGE
ncbi:acyl-CoA desaturase [Aspergillus brunneoviolaceus CBS 621.78]|uniref:Delta-9 desaturase isoenzyme B n=1 Tax=Aspergillus brunneoviolaceus CBS 621.78 TaxID=1450534 RepID=A0ACD1GNH5_9EURO|nr:delta-9 desaturase isoenzyme B [Aspergillus brunneoviolaceus CBS 621.78]RAH50674.1 delta-9 desaturase isoenzyme B [Aspergillus brunneoviolaceus CBS 621.78]